MIKITVVINKLGKKIIYIIIINTFDGNSYNIFVAMNATANTLIELNPPRFLQIIMGIAFAVIFLLGTCW